MGRQGYPSWTGSTPRSTTGGHLWPPHDHRGGCPFTVGVNCLFSLFFFFFFFFLLLLLPGNPWGVALRVLRCLVRSPCSPVVRPLRGGSCLVPQRASRVSSTRPLADNCRATCRIKVTESPWRISSKACDRGHPWRSAVTRLVTSKNTVFAEEPNPAYPFRAPAGVSHPGPGCTPGLGPFRGTWTRVWRPG